LGEGRFESASRTLGEYVSRRPEDARGRYQYARALLGAGRREEGRAELGEAVRIEPDLSGARLLLGRFALAEGSAGEAWEHLRRAGTSTAAVIGRVRVELLRGETGTAIRHLRELFLGEGARGADFAPSRVALAGLLESRWRIFSRPGDRETAKILCETARADLTGRETAPARITRLRALLGMGSYREAMTLALAEVEGSGGDHRAGALLLLAAAHDGQDDREGARERVRSALDSTRDEGVLRSAIRFWLRRGEIEETAVALERALRLESGGVDLVALDAFLLAWAGDPDIAMGRIEPVRKACCESDAALRCLVAVAELAERESETLEMLSERGSSPRVERAKLRLLIATGKAKGVPPKLARTDPLDPETLLVTAGLPPVVDTTWVQYVTPYTVLARRVVSSGRPSPSEALRREGALRDYERARSELAEHLAEWDGRAE
jgi:tetratricopeptide (TPR) repeat protein